MTSSSKVILDINKITCVACGNSYYQFQEDPFIRCPNPECKGVQLEENYHDTKILYVDAITGEVIMQ